MLTSSQFSVLGSKLRPEVGLRAPLDSRRSRFWPAQQIGLAETNRYYRQTLLGSALRALSGRAFSASGNSVDINQQAGRNGNNMNQKNVARRIEDSVINVIEHGAMLVVGAIVLASIMLLIAFPVVFIGSTAAGWAISAGVLSLVALLTAVIAGRRPTVDDLFGALLGSLVIGLGAYAIMAQYTSVFN